MTLTPETRELIDTREWSKLWQPAGDIALTNHGSFGRTFRAVRTLHASIEVETDTDPARFFRYDHHDEIEAAADAIGRFLGMPADQAAAFTHNASTAVLEAAAAYATPQGPILTTSLGYGGIRYGLVGLAPRLATSYEEVELDSIDDAAMVSNTVLEAVERYTPSVIVLDQISSATAMRLPVEAMIPAIQASSPETRIVIDAAHAAGMERNPVVAGADAWVSNLHKWVCASTGAAVIVTERGSDLAPAFRSWTGDDPFPRSFTWIGTDAKAAYLSAPLATEIMDRLIAADLDGHITGLLDEVGDHLAETWNVAADPRPDGMAAPWMRPIEVPIRSLTQDELNGASLIVRDQLKTDVIFTQFQGSTFLRLSAHGYNKLGDYERLAKVPSVLSSY